MEGRATTIAALATASGRGALAVVRVSGPDSFQIFSHCIDQKARFAQSRPREVALYTVRCCEENSTIDEVTAVKWVGPRSFTGEDVVEITCHGSPVIVESVIEELCRAGAQLAGRGEFTRRAFENGKLDLLKAEAILGLIESTSVASARGAQRAYRGGYADMVERWREELVDLAGDVEADVEFGEEDDVQGISRGWVKSLSGMAEEIRGELELRRLSSGSELGMRVVIAGPSNAGKSSLFNYLVGYERSIVDSEPGTTRDVVSERVRMGGHEVVLVDSAGFRDGGERIEAEGMRRSSEEAKLGDVVVWVTSALEPLLEQEKEWIGGVGGNAVFVVNKRDLDASGKKDAGLRQMGLECLSISVLTKENLEHLVERIVKEVRMAGERVEVSDVFLNRRHEEIGERMVAALEEAIQNASSPEIVAFHVGEALTCLGELVGKTASEDVVNRIFEKFCIGK